ncbi:MAG: CDP-glucose 4,6-dehydratase [Chloroflexi bacterium]|nr:CDP-glucose 4,6-dehydratase [Chloroflexota bacterium]
MALDTSFWRGRRVLVTGHTGFKGSWLSVWLQALGAQLSGFAIGVPTRPSLYEMAGVHGGIDSVEGDIRDRFALAAEIQRSRPEIVIHMAAQATVLSGYASPVETYETNVMGTINLLDAIRQVGTTRAVLVVTSDKCYLQGSATRPFREDDPLGGGDPYSASKACAEIAAASYRASYFSPNGQRGTALATARAGNVVGGGDWTENRLVPDLIRAFRAGKIAQIRNPEHVRPWQHVLDPLSGYLRLVERLFHEGDEYAEAWNFGPATSSCVSVGEVADRVAALWDQGSRWETVTSTSPRESPQLRVDSGKAISRLAWTPRLDLDRCLRWTVEWYRTVEAGGSARSVTLGQIDSYAR